MFSFVIFNCDLMAEKNILGHKFGANDLCTQPHKRCYEFADLLSNNQ